MIEKPRQARENDKEHVARGDIDRCPDGSLPLRFPAFEGRQLADDGR